MVRYWNIYTTPFGKATLFDGIDAGLKIKLVCDFLFFQKKKRNLIYWQCVIKNAKSIVSSANNAPFSLADGAFLLADGAFSLADGHFLLAYVQLPIA